MDRPFRSVPSRSLPLTAGIAPVTFVGRSRDSGSPEDPTDLVGVSPENDVEAVYSCGPLVRPLVLPRLRTGCSVLPLVRPLLVRSPSQSLHSLWIFASNGTYPMRLQAVRLIGASSRAARTYDDPDATSP